MVASTSVIQDIIPQLAVSLGQIRRVPGKGDAWIGHVTDTLQKAHDPRYDRMRRRIGFAQRLATMAGLPDTGTSRITLGLFFHELMPAKQNGARGARPWRQYFLRNEEWLRPALEICEAIDSKGWDEVDDGAEIVAKTAATYDAGTLEGNQRSLAVVESMMDEVEGHAAQRIVDLLWTEDGQALCDHHFRRHPRGYRLDTKDIKAGLSRLYRVPTRVAAEVALQSMRMGDAEASEQHEQEVEQPVSQPESRNGGSDNFDQRKSALRARKDAVRATAVQPDDGETTYEVDDMANVEVPSQIEAKLREIEAKEQQKMSSEPIARPTVQIAAEAAPPAREERMNQMTTVAPTSRNEALDVREKLQDLRIQLGQIQQIAAEAEHLLAGIAPHIDEFATRIADVEAVMDRWSGRPRIAA
jgi:hypothetical protein